MLSDVSIQPTTSRPKFLKNRGSRIGVAGVILQAKKAYIFTDLDDTLWAAGRCHGGAGVAGVDKSLPCHTIYPCVARLLQYIYWRYMTPVVAVSARPDFLPGAGKKADTHCGAARLREAARGGRHIPRNKS